MNISLLQEIAKSGMRIFDREDIDLLFEKLTLSKNYTRKMLSESAKKNHITSLEHGLYTLPLELLAEGPIHAFEIAMKLAKKGAISHRSAMAHYELTDQVLSRVYVTVPKIPNANLSSTKIYKISGTRFELIRVPPEKYWGVKQIVFPGGAINITDIERTLIDGLKDPEHCGGFREVAFAFERAFATFQIDQEKLHTYAIKSSIAVAKRLGWILEHINEGAAIQEKLLEIPVRAYQRLDPSKNKSGKYNAKWKIIENM